MRVLVIDDDAKVRAATLRQYAIEHKENLNALVSRMTKGELAPGNNPNFVLELFDGWRVVMTIEQQPPPQGWCYHLSVSVVPQRADKATPNPVAIETMLLPLLGIKATLRDAVNISHTGNIVELWFKYEGPE
jgi:hypothetical protein